MFGEELPYWQGVHQLRPLPSRASVYAYELKAEAGSGQRVHQELPVSLVYTLLFKLSPVSPPIFPGCIATHLYSMPRSSAASLTSVQFCRGMCINKTDWICRSELIRKKKSFAAGYFCVWRCLTWIISAQPHKLHQHNQSSDKLQCRNSRKQRGGGSRNVLEFVLCQIQFI